MKSVTYLGSSETQGGGHGRIRACRVQPGNIPAISKPLDRKEGICYEAFQKLRLKEVIPKFFGVLDNCVIIEDITAGFTSPCLADFKVGKRHYDPDAPSDKVSGLIAKQKGSTTDSHGLRLIDGKIRKGGKVTKEWDRKVGLKFSESQLEAMIHEFIPPSLKDQFNRKLDALYDIYNEHLEKNPGFRMYAASILIGYDGDKPTELRQVLIDFAHTHLSLKDEGYDPEKSEYDDGVMEGISSMMNFATTIGEAPKKLGLVYERSAVILEGAPRHEHIQRVTVDTSTGQKAACLLRPHNEGELAAYTRLQDTPLRKWIPTLYGAQEGHLIVEDIHGGFSSPCLIDLRISSRKNEPGSKEDQGENQQIRLRNGHLAKNKKVVKSWKPGDCSSLNYAQITDVYKEFLPDSLNAKVGKELDDLRAAYLKTRETTPGFRLYGTSLLICYDGDDLAKSPRVVLNGFWFIRFDIAKEGAKADDPKTNDGFVEGLDIVRSCHTESGCCDLL
jgi:hypothetical protein